MVDKKRTYVKRLFPLTALGLFSGFINGMFGSGGGVPIVLWLWQLAREELVRREDVFANVTAMILPISLSSAFVYFTLSTPDLSSGIEIGVGALVGGIIGSMLLSKLKMDALKKIFAILLLVSGAIMIFR